LAPTKQELEQAIEKFQEFNKNFPPHKKRTFVLVTPYV
jgi:outer membrane protein assembly factor BamD (BamD/ComL family)